MISVSRDVGPVGVIGERQNVQSELPRAGDLLARTARLASAEAHPQGGMPDQEAVHSRHGILDGAALGQVDPPLHAELVAALLHVLQDRLLTPRQGLGTSLCPGELDDHLVPADLLEHS